MTHRLYVLTQLVAGMSKGHPNNIDKEALDSFTALADRICDASGVCAGAPIEQQVYITNTQVPVYGIV